MLTKGLKQLYGYDFVLLRSGSRVSGTQCPSSDLDLVCLRRSLSPHDPGCLPKQPVVDMVTKLEMWLRKQPGVSDVLALKKRLTLVRFCYCGALMVDVCVQVPWSVLSSWHLRALNMSSSGGCLASLATKVKCWAQSKAIGSAAHETLAPYGWSLLVSFFLVERGLLVLPELPRSSEQLYLTTAQAYDAVLEAHDSAMFGTLDFTRCWECASKPEVPPRTPEQWSDWLGTPEPEVSLGSTSDDALFPQWLDWMLDDTRWTMRGGRPFIFALQRKTQEQLWAGVAAQCADFPEAWVQDWEMCSLAIEAPLQGVNVARCVTPRGLAAIVQELRFAKDYMTLPGTMFQDLLRVKPLLAQGLHPNVPVDGFKVWFRNLTMNPDQLLWSLGCWGAQHNAEMALQVASWSQFFCDQIVELTAADSRSLHDIAAANVSRLVQDALKKVPADFLIIISAIFLRDRQRIHNYMRNKHANYVLQQFLDVVPLHAVPAWLDLLLENVHLVKDRHWCRVFQRPLDRCPTDMALPLVEALVRQFRLDPDVGFNKNSSSIFSYVVKHGTQLMVDALIHHPRQSFLARDICGSYIVQRVVENADAEQVRQLLESQESWLPSLRETPGRFVLQAYRRKCHHDKDLRARLPRMTYMGSATGAQQHSSSRL